MMILLRSQKRRRKMLDIHMKIMDKMKKNREKKEKMKRERQKEKKKKKEEEEVSTYSVCSYSLVH